MKTFKILLTTVSLIFISGCSRQSSNFNQSVNAIIGDISFTKTFAGSPTLSIDEDLRIKTHLKYVEVLLRKRNPKGLSSKQRINRKHMLDLLYEYWSAGVFPRNYDYPGKHIPCFIDRDGRICAVGYLIEQTAGRAAAEAINAKYKYEYVMEMNDPAIEQWIQSSGLTKIECAMIQPSYNFVTHHIPAEYAISSALLSGINFSMSTINCIQATRGTSKKFAPYTGIITGAGQITLGLFNYPSRSFYISSIPVSQRNLSLLNIGLGTGTLIFSSWNLIANKEPKDKTVSWNIYSFPTMDNGLGMGFSISKRL